MEAVARGRLAKGGLIAIGLALAACAGGDAPTSSGFRAVGVEPAVVTSAIPVDDLTPASAAAVPGAGTDQCGAGDLQWLVGRDRSEIPVPVNPYGRRVTCTTCAVTEDFSPTRLNIFFDQDSNKVQTVRCG